MPSYLQIIYKIIYKLYLQINLQIIYKLQIIIIYKLLHSKYWEPGLRS